MKRQNILFGVLAAAAIALIGVWFWANPISLSKSPKATANGNANTNAAVELPTTIAYQGVEGQNALDLLKASHVVIEDNGFVQAIDGRANSATSYWFLYVNGTSSDKGAKDVMTTSSDSIEWRFEEWKGE